MQGKSDKFSISFPPTLRDAMDRHIGTKPRSRYLQELAERDLRNAGALDVDPVADELLRTRELIETRGIDAVRAKLDELAEEAAAAAAGDQ